MKMDESLMDENEDVIASFRFLDMDENNYNVYVNFVSCFLYLSRLKRIIFITMWNKIVALGLPKHKP